MNTTQIQDPLYLEELIFGRLHQEFPQTSVFGHVTVVHENKCWVLYLFSHSNTLPQDFHRLTRELAIILDQFWHREHHLPSNHTGRDTDKNHYHQVWLPVEPNGMSEDFARSVGIADLV